MGALSLMQDLKVFPLPSPSLNFFLVLVSRAKPSCHAAGLGWIELGSDCPPTFGTMQARTTGVVAEMFGEGHRFYLTFLLTCLSTSFVL